MAQTQKPKAEVVPLFRRRAVGEGEQEVRMGLPPAREEGAAMAAGTAAPTIDLSGKPKVLFLIGPGGTGNGNRRFRS